MKIWKVRYIENHKLIFLFVIAKTEEDCMKAVNELYDLPPASQVIVQEISTARPVNAKVIHMIVQDGN